MYRIKRDRIEGIAKTAKQLSFRKVCRKDRVKDKIRE